MCICLGCCPGMQRKTSCADGLQAADEQTGSKAAMSAVGVPQKSEKIIRSGDGGKQFIYAIQNMVVS